MSAAEKLRPVATVHAAANDVEPELRPFVVAMARLLVADLRRRPPAKESR